MLMTGTTVRCREMGTDPPSPLPYVVLVSQVATTPLSSSR